MALLLDRDPNPDNYYAILIRGQRFARIPTFQLESGERLDSCPIAYRTWGALNAAGDNVLVICHALTGSSDVSDWWSPLIGPGKAFDPNHFFIFCANVLGSPYGSASPLTTDPGTGTRYAGDFPETTVRDDVNAHKLVLDDLGVKSIAAVIGGSMGGMTTLEWALCTVPGYVKNIIPIATAADHSAWGISWAETQRQCIYSDPKFDDGFYDPTPEGQPTAGLAAARMIAMLTYRSGMSFDSRFGRNPQRERKLPSSQTKLTEPHLDLPRTDIPAVEKITSGKRSVGKSARSSLAFTAQGYLHHQGEKFIKRFDANCYLHLTHKMDSHDVTRGRVDEIAVSGDDVLQLVLSKAPPGALVIGVETDALFLPEKQERLAACLPKAELAVLKSLDGHDGFLLEFEQLDLLIQAKLRAELPRFYDAAHIPNAALEETEQEGASLTGEVEEW